MPTVAIAPIREHAVKIGPPRALFVPFELGRPLGVPGDAAFQHRVLRAALALFDATAGPVLADYPEDAPVLTASDAAWVCPIPAPRPPERPDSPGPAAALLLMALDDPARVAAAMSGEPPDEAVPASQAAQAIRLAAEDLKAWYQEAAMARPGVQPSGLRLADWFFGETIAGHVVLALRNRCKAADDPAIKLLGTSLLVPRGQAHRSR